MTLRVQQKSRRAFPVLGIALVFAFFVCYAIAQSARGRASDRERLIGAWHLEHIDSGSGGSPDIHRPRGTLIYSRDGHMSVQLMYPESARTLSNDYVLNGYEASFGTWEIDEAKHLVTHHVEGSITHGLVGKNLVRAYQLSGDRLLIKSADPKEHWIVTWKRDG